jgi:DNA-binding Xre family transcriptional regulator
LASRTPYADLAVRAEVRLSAAPAAHHVAVLVATAGDDLDTVARGLGMDIGWLRALVGGEVEWLDASQAHRLCAALEVEPSEVFGAGAGELLRAWSAHSATVRSSAARLGAPHEEPERQAGERGPGPPGPDDGLRQPPADPVGLSPQAADPAASAAADNRQVVEGLERRPSDPYARDLADPGHTPEVGLGP